MPDLSEVNDRTASGGAAPGSEDGHGHDTSETHGQSDRGLRKDFGRKDLNRMDALQHGSEIPR
jgi:hypothetical protein